ncbi:MAG: hypothetical protein CVT68_02315 [Actinobacteria bacterium HGW-Actinobacteria-8]|nr:MAG: hypothetical protein CVT68_02315 [Actinobacteria bacterium HGW-Actinobacteria-8]
MNTSPENTRPVRSGIGLRLTLAAAVAVVGLTASIVWAAVGLADQTRRPADMVTTTTPGSVIVQITRPGTHVVYLESAVPTAARDLVPSLALTASDITVTGPDERPVETRAYTLDLRYDPPRGSGIVGQAFAVFDAEQSGTYVVATDVALEDTTARIAVGDDLVPGVLRAILLPMLTGAFSLIAAILLALRALMRTGQQARSTNTERSA